MRIKDYGDEVRISYCPICQKKKKDNPCFSVNVRSGLYMCYSQNKGGHIDEFPQIKKELGITTTDSNYIREPKEIKDFTDIMVKSKELNSEWLEYLKSRGIENFDNINKYVRLGKNNFMLIPITDGKVPCGIKYRDIGKKYLHCESGTNTDYLIGWQHIKDFEYLLIVEGEIDLLTALEVGFLNVVSLPNGAGNIKCIANQKKWISQFKKIIIATDNDEQGKKAQQEILYELKDLYCEFHKINYGKSKDLNELLQKKGAEKLKEILTHTSKIKTGFKNFKVNNECYMYFSDKGAIKATDFTLEITAYSDNFLIGTVNNGKSQRDFKARISELLSIKGIAEHFGLYLANSNTLPLFINYLKEENSEKYIKEIEHYGIIDNVYYDLDSEAVCSKGDLKICSLSSIEPLTNDEKNWLDKNLVYMRKDVNQSLLGICWALGRYHNLENYPILEVSGTTSIGKTEFVEFISRLLFGSKENIKSLATITNHQIRAFSSCSNLTPWAIDEVKMSGKFSIEKTTELFSTIRSVYDNKTINQGNTSTKLYEFKLYTPLIISGETKIEDVSIRNRMINTSLTKGNKADFEVYKTLKTTQILEKLAREVLNDRLENGELEVDNSILKILDERQLYNATCLLKGLKALCRVVNIDKEIINDFIAFLNKEFAEEYNPTKNFLELLKLVEDADIPNKEEFYYKNEETKEHWARFQILYTHIVDQHKKTNSTLELLDMRTVRKQLLESGFITNNNFSTTIKTINTLGHTEYKKVKLVKFKLEE